MRKVVPFLGVLLEWIYAVQFPAPLFSISMQNAGRKMTYNVNTHLEPILK